MSSGQGYVKEMHNYWYFIYVSYMLLLKAHGCYVGILNHSQREAQTCVLVIRLYILLIVGTQVAHKGLYIKLQAYHILSSRCKATDGSRIGNSFCSCLYSNRIVYSWLGVVIKDTINMKERPKGLGARPRSRLVYRPEGLCFYRSFHSLMVYLFVIHT